MKYVIFDMDGVLLDSETGAFRTLQESLRQIGIEESLESLLETYVGKTSRRIVEELLEKHHSSVTPDEFMKLHHARGSYYAVSDEVKPMEGLEEFLIFLRDRKVRMAVVSSTSSRNVLTALNRMRLLKYFDAVVCSDALAESKPSPEGYLKAVHYLNADRSECIVIEDSPVGIQAGKNAGIYVVGYKGATHKQDTSKADLEVYTYEELKNKLMKK